MPLRIASMLTLRVPSAREKRISRTRFDSWAFTGEFRRWTSGTMSRRGKLYALAWVSKSLAGRPIPTRVRAYSLYLTTPASSRFAPIAILSSLGKPSGMRTLTPVHDAADEDAAAVVSSLGQTIATPPLPAPKRVADGMQLAPTKAYLAQVDVPSRGIAPDGRPRLVVFDLDGTVRRCATARHSEHD